MSDDPRATAATERARDRIDSGRTGDKVPFPDPATAPMHTGAEAAGQPTPKEAAEADVRHQEAIAASFDRHVEPMSAHATPERRRMNRKFAVGLGVVLAAVVAVVLLVASYTAPS